MEIQWGTLAFGLIIFGARIIDVSAGTMRTIAIVNGRTLVAFFLGLAEISLWLAVMSEVLAKIGEEPLLALFYALGFSTGNVVGIKLEKHLGMGCQGVRIFNRKNGREMAENLRVAGYRVTTFWGQGKDGPVRELYTVCRRRDLSRLLGMVRQMDPEAFYVTEHAGQVSKVYRPMSQPASGWRAIMKKK